MLLLDVFCIKKAGYRFAISSWPTLHMVDRHNLYATCHLKTTWNVEKWQVAFRKSKCTCDASYRPLCAWVDKIYSPKAICTPFDGVYCTCIITKKLILRNIHGIIELPAETGEKRSFKWYVWCEYNKQDFQ